MCVCVCVCVCTCRGRALIDWALLYHSGSLFMQTPKCWQVTDFLRGHSVFWEENIPHSLSLPCVCVCGGGVGLRVVPISSLKPHPCGAWGPHVQSLPQSEQVEGQCSWLGCERIKETRVSLNTLNTGSQPPLCSARPWPGVWGTPGSSGIMSYLVWVCQNP